MPWKRAKALPPPDNSLFEACFRIQREACEAAGRHIPLVVESVRGAQPWVGRARWHFGSFYLWGDVPALMPMPKKAIKVNGFRFDGSGRSFQSESVKVATMGAGWYPPGHPKHVAGLAFNGHAERNLRLLCDCGHAKKAHGINGNNSDQPCSLCSCINPVYTRRTAIGKGARFTSRDCGVEGVKAPNNGYTGISGWGNGHTASKSTARKAASAHIAKIPFVLAQWIARTYKPDKETQC